MARGADSDYIGSLSLMGEFDTDINFDGFGENMKTFMELPIKYLDSTHDKAVGLVEDIHALIFVPLPDDEVPNKGHGTLKDPSSNNVITGSSSTSVKIELVDPNEEFSSPPTSLITAGNTLSESFSTKCPENTSSEGGHIEVNDLCMLSEDTSITEICGIYCKSRCTSEDTISLGRTVSIKEEVILWNPPQPPEPTTIFCDDASHEVNTDTMMEQVELHSSGHSESCACNGAILLGKIGANGEEQSELYSANDSEESTQHGLQDDQERMKNHKGEVSSVPQSKNTSFKKLFMRSLSNKLRCWKKGMNVHQAVPVRVQVAGHVRCQAGSSSDGLEDDWELL